MKITLYSVETCKYSAEEREYLKSKNIPFEEKDVEKDHAALEEMLKIGNNFAGTPVTSIAKDDAAVVVLKGFTKEEFEKELFPPADAIKPAEGVEKPAAPATAAPVDPNAPAAAPAPGAVAPTEMPPMPQAAPVDQNMPPAAAQPPAVTAPAAPAPNPLDSILQDLQSKIPPPTLDNQSPTSPPQQPGAAPASAQMPAVPDFPQTQ